MLKTPNKTNILYRKGLIKNMKVKFIVGNNEILSCETPSFMYGIGKEVDVLGVPHIVEQASFSRDEYSVYLINEYEYSHRNQLKKGV